jgi:hypothetical protein
VAQITNGDGPGPWWPRLRFFLILSAGLVLGGTAFAWQQQRRKQQKAAKASVITRLMTFVHAETASDRLGNE